MLLGLNCVFDWGVMKWQVCFLVYVYLYQVVVVVIGDFCFWVFVGGLEYVVVYVVEID